MYSMHTEGAFRLTFGHFDDLDRPIGHSQMVSFLDHLRELRALHRWFPPVKVLRHYDAAGKEIGCSRAGGWIRVRHYLYRPDGSEEYIGNTGLLGHYDTQGACFAKTHQGWGRKARHEVFDGSTLPIPFMAASLYQAHVAN
jgi:hypothetical protein